MYICKLPASDLYEMPPNCHQLSKISKFTSIGCIDQQHTTKQTGGEERATGSNFVGIQSLVVGIDNYLLPYRNKDRKQPLSV